MGCLGSKFLKFIKSIKFIKFFKLETGFCMKMVKSHILFVMVVGFFVVPRVCLGQLRYEDLVSRGFDYSSVSAYSVIVANSQNGEVYTAKNENASWRPASLTKLVTALVVLDKNPSLKGNVIMKKDDEVGGARIATKTGVSYRVNDLFNASLIASANNATNALARSTGISRDEFVKLMNEKALLLGATNTLFVEPTGISENNFTTATDFVKIAKVAFENNLISGVSQKKDYKFSAVNNKKYVHKIKSTNQLLGSEDLIIKGGKTGYIDESQYNFVTRMQDKSGKDVIVLVLGSKDKQSEFLEAKKLALWSWSKSLLPSVAGVSTVR